MVICFVLSLPGSRQRVSGELALVLFLLAVVANVLYCAAYIPDLVIQSSSFRERRVLVRSLIFIVGTCFAGIVTRYISLGMFA